MKEADLAPEKTHLRLGYIPLTDCLPLVVAREKGFFAQQGLDVELCREASWATIRDRLVIGELDAAHMLAPMLLASTLGLGGVRKPMLTAFSLGLNGNAITVSNALFSALQDQAAGDSARDALQALTRVIALRRDQRREPLVFAMVFPFSCHNYLLRQWLAAGGIDPDRDIKLVALPPAQMVDNLRLGHIDGFCVGEPWNSVALAVGVGSCLATGYDIWQNAPDKVLGVTEQWCKLYPATHAALLRALSAAAQWAESHTLEALALLVEGHYLELPLEYLTRPLRGELRAGLGQNPRAASEFHVFNRYQANFPWRSHANWFLQQMLRWGQLGDDVAVAGIVEQVYRSDIYRQTFQGRLSLPLSDSKGEGEHSDEWQLPGDTTPLGMGPDGMINDLPANTALS